MSTCSYFWSTLLIHDHVLLVLLNCVLRERGFHVSVGHKKKNPSLSNPSLTIQCDAVVVGSGSGGGVIAGVLANAGYKVLVLEKGPTVDQMYEGAGLMSTQDLGISILAGSTVGGGSTINWSASIRTPRNAPADHYCGWCFLGCKDGRKRGTSETWLKDLVHSGNGAIIPNCEATKILHHKRKGRTRSTATGVAFEFSYKGAKEICTVDSKVTIVSSGALNTPVLLRKSGLKNKHIGKNLHLHPVTMAWGYFPETNSPIEDSKKSYEGGIMTAMSSVVDNTNTSGYGAIIQTPSLHPGYFSALMPWTSGADMKLRMSRFSRTAHIFALARDEGSGQVSSKTSQAISYKLDSADETNLKKGIEKMLRILAAAGAEEIGTHHLKGERINVKKASSQEFEMFVKRESERELKGLSSSIASAHQMGSCRMGVDPMGSAVNPMGETWEVEGLFVGDASVFPSALGVNPMVTVQAIAYCTAQSVVQVLNRKTTTLQ